jgi:uncharacterized membrane protein YoaK (UPF0700 family)
LPWAALLAGIAGYVDAICYLRLGGAFAANMTGNLVEVGLAVARGQWKLAIWCASLLVAFLLGILAARLVLRTQHSARLSLLLEAAIIVVAATGVFGIAAVPVLAAAMALQNEAVTHGIVALNVGFITGDLQRIGERLIPAAEPAEPRKRNNRVALLLTMLCSGRRDRRIACAMGRGRADSPSGAARRRRAAARAVDRIGGGAPLIASGGAPP